MKIYNDTEFTLAFLKGLEWKKDNTYLGKDSATLTTYTAKAGGKIFRKDEWSDGVIVYNA